MMSDNENSVPAISDVHRQLVENEQEEIVPIVDSCLSSGKIKECVDEAMDVLDGPVSKIEENIQVNLKVNTISESLENQHLKESNDISTGEVGAEILDSLDVDTNINKETQVTCNQNLEEEEEYVKLSYDWVHPKLICSATKEFLPSETCENFTKGCFWSPDGTCILVPSEDCKIRMFQLPREFFSGKLPENFCTPTSEQSGLQVKEGGTIYDNCWFPYMNSWDPSTCCFLCTSQGSPIHLWDSLSGQLRATYRAYNQVDEVEAAISVQFTDFGGQIWSGFKNALRTFDTNRPGRQINTIYLKKDFPNVTGMVSCIRENPGMAGLIAFGTYSKCIGLYKDGPLCSFKTGSGVTQIEFSPCGTKLYSSVRRSNELLCWDLRNPGAVLYSLQNRLSDTNQRIHFTLSYDGSDIISGGTDGSVRIWKIPDDLQFDEDLDPSFKINLSKDCVNGISLHKNLPILATSTGSRICEEEEIGHRDNSLRLYWLGDS